MTTMVASVTAAPPMRKDENVLSSSNDIDDDDIILSEDFGTDTLSERLFREAREVLETEPELCSLLHHTVLAEGVHTFEEAVATTVTYRLMMMQQQTSTSSSSLPCFCPDKMKSILLDAMRSTELEAGHTMSQAVRRDAVAVCQRDPACETILEVVLFFKGFAALVCHRAARRKWFAATTTSQQQQLPSDSKDGTKRRRNFTSLFLQSQASAIFGIDIHPAASIGAGVMFDHGTGIVIGETATIGDGSTLLHGVTLGGTGKQGGDRHPKVGQNVLIGAGASILGNITIGDGAKIGAGSIVLGPIPKGATAVGAPAKIVGRALEPRPGSFMDDTLQNVGYLHKSSHHHRRRSISPATDSTATTSSDDESESHINDGDDDERIRSTNDRINDKRKKKTSTLSTTSDANATEKSVKDHEKDDHSNGSGDESDENNNNNDSIGSNICCPYREYKHLALKAPKGTITILTIGKLLHPEGCLATEIGPVFFSLDDDNVGYVHPSEDVYRRIEHAIQENTSITDLQKIQELVAKLKTNLVSLKSTSQHKSQQQQQNCPTSNEGPSLAPPPAAQSVAVAG